MKCKMLLLALPAVSSLAMNRRTDFVSIETTNEPDTPPPLGQEDRDAQQHRAQSSSQSSVLITVNSIDELKELFKDTVVAWGPEHHQISFHTPHRKSIVLHHRFGESVLTPSRNIDWQDGEDVPDLPDNIWYASEDAQLAFAYCRNSKSFFLETQEWTFRLNNEELVFNNGKFFTRRNIMECQPDSTVKDITSSGFTISYHEPSSTSSASADN